MLAAALCQHRTPHFDGKPAAFLACAANVQPPIVSSCIMSHLQIKKQEMSRPGRASVSIFNGENLLFSPMPQKRSSLIDRMKAAVVGESPPSTVVPQGIECARAFVRPCHRPHTAFLFVMSSAIIYPRLIHSLPFPPNSPT